MPKGRTKNETVDMSEVDGLEPISTPPKPDWLNAEGSREWDRITKIMTELGTLQSRDLPTLATYCQTYGQFIELQATIRDEPKVYIGYKGAAKASPNIDQSMKLASTLRGLAGELKLTPASRKIKVDEDSPKRAMMKDFKVFLDGEDTEVNPSDFGERPMHAVEKPLSK